MITGSLIMLGKVAIMGGLGLILASGAENFVDAKIKPASNIIKLGSKKGGKENDDKIDNLSKRIKEQQG